MSSMFPWSPGITIKQIEKEVILQALKFYSYNKTKTAIALGISIRTLDNRLVEYDVKIDHETKKVIYIGQTENQRA